MMQRRTLPQRRANVTFQFEHDMERGGAILQYRCTVGYFTEGDIGEVFVNLNKHGLALDASVSEGAIMISIALQHGVPLETLRSAIKRDQEGFPASPVGMALDEIVRRDLITIPKEWPVEATKVEEPPTYHEDTVIDPKIKAMNEARWQGYAPEPCTQCKCYTLVRNGSCLKCNTCGSTTGCS